MNQIVRGGDDPTPPEGGTTRMPQTSGLRGQIPPSSRISKEIRTADTATVCQTQKALQTGIEPMTFRSRGDIIDNHSTNQASSH